jgi:hypothetical protein
MFCYSNEGVKEQEPGVKNAKRIICIEDRLRFIRTVTDQTSRNVRKYSDREQ